MKNYRLMKNELERYSRQILIWGAEGQLKLKESSVTIVGLGGLGSIISLYLVAAGIGKLFIVDKSKVKLDNLNRQILYTINDIGKNKALIAREKLLKLNPNVDIEAYPETFDEKIGDKLVSKSDLVIDALDNWETRIILNKICVKYRKTLIHGGVSENYGQLMVIIPGKTPCLQCIFPQKIERREIFPIFGPIPGIIGSLEALEAIKILTNYAQPALNKLIFFDGRNLSLKILRLKRNPKCPVCGRLK